MYTTANLNRKLHNLSAFTVLVKLFINSSYDLRTSSVYACADSEGGGGGGGWGPDLSDICQR